MAKGDETALRLSTLMQMVYPGAPCIYYGDEIGMAGGKDPMCRGSFLWDEKDWNRDLRNFFKKTIALRHSHPALRRGDYVTLLARDSIYALGRQEADDRVVIAFNVGHSIAEARIPVGEFLPEGTILRDAFKKDEARVENGEIRVHIFPRAGIALEVVP
jgi:neopullulanase